MRAFDVNVLVYAFRPVSDEQERVRAVVEQAVQGDVAFGVLPEAIAGFLRLVTNPRVFAAPSSLDDALAFARALRGAPSARRIVAGDDYSSIFERVVRATNAVAGVVADAHFAALAIEHDLAWVTCDAGFARFPGLSWMHPLDEAPRRNGRGR